MIYLLLFFAEVFLLFLFSRAMSQRLSILFYKVTRSVKTTINMLAFIYLPGTLLHEMAHLLMALALFVRVGKMELIPKMEGEGRVKMGSVQIAKVDLIRSLIVGVAPVILGITLLLASLHFTLNFFIKAYITFEIGNTMFSSRKDIEGGVKLLITLGAVLLLAYLLGFRISADMIGNFLSARQSEIVKTGDLFLLIPLAIDGLLLLLLSLL